MGIAEQLLYFGGFVVFGAVVVVGGIARLRGGRSRLDRIGDSLGALRDVDGMPPGVLGNPTELPRREDDRRRRR